MSLNAITVNELKAKFSCKLRPQRAESWKNHRTRRTLIFKNKSKIAIVKKKYQNQKDEQNLLSKHGRLFCSKDRTNALHEAEEEGYELAILDDGLQDKNLSYDLSIVCFNNDVGIGNGLLIPAGPLRENVSELKNYDAIFLNGEKKNKKLSKYFKKLNKNIIE